MLKAAVLFAIGVGIVLYVVHRSTRKVPLKDTRAEDEVILALNADRKCWPIWKDPGGTN